MDRDVKVRQRIRFFVVHNYPTPSELLDLMCPPPEFSQDEVKDALAKMTEEKEIMLLADRHLTLLPRNR